jgi:hypothetical protein
MCTTEDKRNLHIMFRNNPVVDPVSSSDKSDRIKNQM